MSKIAYPILGTPAIVTGASSGIGRELAVLFSGTGHVILSGRNEHELEATRLLCKDPANTTKVCGDLADSGTRERLASFADLYKAYYLICCAGEYLRGPLEKSSPTAINDVLASNFTATINLVREVYPALLRSHTGCIVHINSVAGIAASSDEPVYAATKHGLTGFFRSLRFDARRKGIRVLDVFLGGTQTPMASPRDDFEYLISPKEAAQIIYNTAVMKNQTVYVPEITLERFRFH